MGRKSRKAQKGGIRLVDSNFSMPRIGYYEAGIFEGAPGSDNIGAYHWINNPLSHDLTTIPGLGGSDAVRLSRIGIDNTIQLIGYAMLLTGSTPGSGARLILFLRKIGVRYPALVARMLVEKIDHMLLRPTDYANPIVPNGPNNVNYPDEELPQVVIADFADAHGIEQHLASNIYDYAQKFGLTLEKVFEIVQARAKYYGAPIAVVINQLPRQIVAFDRRRHALAAYGAAENAATAATAATATAAAAGNAVANGIDAAAANAAAENAAGGAANASATNKKARRQTRRRRI